MQAALAREETIVTENTKWPTIDDTLGELGRLYMEALVIEQARRVLGCLATTARLRIRPRAKHG